VKRFFLNWWTLTLLAAVLVALLLAFGLPIFVELLRPWWVRLLLALGVALIWGIFALVHVLSARARSDAIAEEIAQPPQPGDEEAAVLSQRMTEAMAALKKASGDKRDYLYSRPWYVIIGPPGAGKTTALHAQSRLLVRRRSGPGRHRRSLHHPGLGRPGGRAGLGAFPRPLAQAATAAADQWHIGGDRRRRTAALRP